MLQAALQAEVQANDNEVTEEATVEPKEEMTERRWRDRR